MCCHMVDRFHLEKMFGDGSGGEYLEVAQHEAPCDFLECVGLAGLW